ncbi:glycosyltransferase [Pseudooceanicola sediminis]|uniref:Glycosyltransferase n=1 Tax=Pseudooceanicola sediminis TaxID=2211117 RepID=A0A399IVF5_9RHOB|nr:glycosyltransferase [Pseudooceanicola sediminis]KAA2311700.1 glycosyltransferase [Puniceibacterium sp. HSS470]RII37135.1 glycosyltransferase [Pseudooceanicola sediminis]|tara:strand:+ start:23016 stop:24116 length:1101 start_codon:yes stop_codon:yes gene_type:complete
MRVLAWPARRNAARNPYQKLLYDAMEAETGTKVIEFGRKTMFARPAPDILHIHWPDVFLAAGKGWKFWPRYFFLRLLFLVAGLRGTRVVWTAHNLRRTGQRNAARLERYFWPWFLARIDGVIFMTEASAEVALESEPALAGKPITVAPHGHYKPVIAPFPAYHADTPDAGLPRILFFGSVTRYKNANEVLRAFLEMPRGSAELRICGEMSRTIPDTRLTEMLAGLGPEWDGLVTFREAFLPEDELVAAIRAADLVVFPYSDVLNSGAAIFALSAGRPMLCSDNRLFQELQAAAGTDWVRLIRAPLDGAQMAQVLAEVRRMRQAGHAPDLSAFDWDRIALDTVSFYQRVSGSADSADRDTPSSLRQE